MNYLCALTLCVALGLTRGDLDVDHELHKRFLPDNEYCDPDAGTCVKGDWIRESIADCHYNGLTTCSVSGDTGGIISWVVGPDRNDECRPTSGKRFRCGAAGTNSRCVCSDYKAPWNFNTCRCQYWTDLTSGMDQPAFCVAKYRGGPFKIHHYACCNNCNDVDTPNTCDGVTYQGGSSGQYCDSCGVPTGGGIIKYTFNCASCRVQAQCKSKCNNRHILADEPGLCWKWVDCFKGCCEVSVAELGGTGLKRSARQAEFNISNIGFCGDGVCSESENQVLCPSDCCYRVNSTCSSDPNECPPECCQWESCCTTGNGAASHNITITIVLTAMCISFAFYLV